jgi:hypothetical protein
MDVGLALITGRLVSGFDLALAARRQADGAEEQRDNDAFHGSGLSVKGFDGCLSGTLASAGVERISGLLQRQRASARGFHAVCSAPQMFAGCARRTLRLEMDPDLFQKGRL